MKKIMMSLAVLLFATAAYAGDHNQPLSVLFQSASTYVPAMKVCRDGDFLRHKTKDYITLRTCSNPPLDCETIHKRLLQPVVSVAQRCAKTSGREGNNCVLWESYRLDQSKVKVFSYSSEQNLIDGKNGRLAGTYTIPACVNK